MEAEAPSAVTTEAAAPITAYKGFDTSLKCRGMQYEIGATVEHAGVVEKCASGLHSCENPLDVFSYYPPGSSRFALVEASGAISRESNGDSKVASARLTVKAELKIPDFIGAASSATGDSSASSATGIAAVALNTGRLGKAQASEGAAIVLCFHNDDGTLRHIRCSKVGDNGIKPHVFYTLDESGEFQEAAQ